MKIIATLFNSAGPLDRQRIDVRDDDDMAEISEQIWQAIEGWILAVGDTIQIREGN